jgi:hypothetical protein
MIGCHNNASYAYTSIYLPYCIIIPAKHGVVKTHYYNKTQQATEVTTVSEKLTDIYVKSVHDKLNSKGNTHNFGTGKLIGGN